MSNSRRDNKIFKNLSRRTNKLELELIDSITQLEIETDCYDININNKPEELTNLNIQLLSIREEKLKGHQIRSRYQHIKDWKKPS